MGRATEVPITPTVLQWAIRESGCTAEDIAKALKVSLQTLEGWAKGTQRPSLTEFRKLASSLKRPEASLLLPEPPQIPPPHVEFRHPQDSARKTLNAVERRYLREASRLQRALSWVLQELRQSHPQLPRLSTQVDPEQAAATTRSALGVSPQQQLSWRDSSVGFRIWRSAVEQSGVLVFLLPMGKPASRGFSLWTPEAPIIAINTWWNVEARSFTLFHEYGHLLTRTASVCSASSRLAFKDGADPIERWCERFAAAALLPWPDVESILRKHGLSDRPIEDLDDLRVLARSFKASLRATALRLIDHRRASWELYEKIPAWSDDKRKGGGAKEGRHRRRIREDQYGRRTHEVFLAALENDVLSRTDVLGLLDITDTDLDHWQQVGTA